MKLTRSEIAEKQADLVAVLLLLEKYKCEKTALEKALAADFEANEKRYREALPPPQLVLRGQARRGGRVGHRFSPHGAGDLPSRREYSPLTEISFPLTG